MPNTKLPSLDLIRGFVAVGRRMSITTAAADLCITQSAMSKQILALEARLGTQLLRRSARGLALTEEGERLFRVADASMNQLQGALDELTYRGRRPVTITTTIGVASLWLLPRIDDFRKKFPDIDVRVAATYSVLDLAAEEIDIAIRYCPAERAPHRSVRLFDEVIAPVASPILGVRSLESEADLREQVLLDYEDRRPWLQWRGWLADRGWSMRSARSVLRFNLYDQVIQAAMAGQGLALGRLPIVRAMIDDGRLEVLPGRKPSIDAPVSYWLVQASDSPREDVARVVRWLIEEGTGSRSCADSEDAAPARSRAAKSRS